MNSGESTQDVLTMKCIRRPKSVLSSLKVMLPHLLTSKWDNFTASPTSLWGIGMLMHRTVFWVPTVNLCQTKGQMPCLLATSTHPSWQPFMHYNCHPANIRADLRASSGDSGSVTYQRTPLSLPCSREQSQLRVCGPAPSHYQWL